MKNVDKIDKIMEALVSDMRALLCDKKKGICFTIGRTEHSARIDVHGIVKVFCRGKTECFKWDGKNGEWKHIPNPDVD